MTRPLTLALAAAATVAMAAPAFAQNNRLSLPPHPNINAAGFSGGPNALPDAIKAIEASTGGHVVEIRYDNVRGVPGYDVALARGKHISFERFSKPGARMVTLAGHTQPDWMLKWPARKDISIAENAQVPLAKAVRTAEAAHNGAPAIAAGIAASSAGPGSGLDAYNVLVLDHHDQRRVAVDANTGAVIANPRMLAPWR